MKSAESPQVMMPPEMPLIVTINDQSPSWQLDVLIRDWFLCGNGDGLYYAYGHGGGGRSKGNGSGLPALPGNYYTGHAGEVWHWKNGEYEDLYKDL